MLFCNRFDQFKWVSFRDTENGRERYFISPCGRDFRPPDFNAKEWGNESHESQGDNMRVNKDENNDRVGDDQRGSASGLKTGMAVFPLS